MLWARERSDTSFAGTTLGVRNIVMRRRKKTPITMTGATTRCALSLSVRTNLLEIFFGSPNRGFLHGFSPWVSAPHVDLWGAVGLVGLFKDSVVDCRLFDLGPETLQF